MGLFGYKCSHCKEKIEKGFEFFKVVKDPLFVELKKKPFCSYEHADLYEKECKCEGNCC